MTTPKFVITPVEVEGTVYPSLKEAGIALGVAGQTVQNRIKSKDPKFSNYSVKQ